MALTDWLKRRFKSTTQPGVPLSGSQIYTGLYSDTGQPITPQTAMNCTTVNACVQAISTELAKLPWSVMKHEGGGRTVAQDHPVHRLLSRAANKDTTALVWRELMLMSACLTGNGYSLIERDAAGRPIGLHYMRPDLMQVIRLGAGQIAYIYSGSEGESVFDSHDVFHLMWLSPDGILGFSPISLARQAIGLALAQETFGASYYRNASRPSGALVTDKELSVDALQRIRESWEARMRGATQAGSVAVLEGGLKWQAISLSPQDSQWLQSREFQREEICSIYRVPPSVVGIGSKQSYSSAEQANREWVSNCLSSWAARLEAEALRKLFREDEAGHYSTDISFDALLRSDMMTRYQAFSVGRQFGFLSVNEIRAEIGRNSIGELGDVYLQPVNMVPASNGFGGNQVAPPSALPDDMPDETDSGISQERAQSFTPTAGMIEEAKRGLAWRSEFKRGGTPVGIARARDIVNGKSLPIETVKRMYSFFARHEVDKKGQGFSASEDGYPSNGRIAWALWGGDAGFTWSKSIVDRLKAKAD
jgi:HK97 family phage portal protein